MARCHHWARPSQIFWGIYTRGFTIWIRKPSHGWSGQTPIISNSILVVLAHDRAIRVQIDAATHKYLRLMFHQRERGDSLMTQCPTLEDHIKRIRDYYAVAEPEEV